MKWLLILTLHNMYSSAIHTVPVVFTDESRCKQAGELWGYHKYTCIPVTDKELTK